MFLLTLPSLPGGESVLACVRKGASLKIYLLVVVKLVNIILILVKLALVCLASIIKLVYIRNMVSLNIFDTAETNRLRSVPYSQPSSKIISEAPPESVLEPHYISLPTRVNHELYNAT